MSYNAVVDYIIIYYEHNLYTDVHMNYINDCSVLEKIIIILINK